MTSAPWLADLFSRVCKTNLRINLDTTFLPPFGYGKRQSFRAANFSEPEPAQALLRYTLPCSMQLLSEWDPKKQNPLRR